MARLVFASDLQKYTGAKEIDVAAANYRQLVKELCERFAKLDETLVKQYSLSIDGVIVQKPMLETIEPDSELVFIARIAGG